MKKTILLFSVLFALIISTDAQTPAPGRGGRQGQPLVPASAKPYAIIIKGGHVVDPKNNIDAIMDIAITRPTINQATRQPNKDGKIAKIAKLIDPKLADQVVNAKGLYVTPGLIDLHVHYFWGTNGSAYMNGPNGLQPDGFTLRSGVTTVVDAGSSGWRSFPTFKKQSIDGAETRVLALLNIVGNGMGGGRYEGNIDDMNADSTAKVALQYKDIIVGIKLAHFNGHTWVPTDRAIRAGTLANIPFMVDFGSANPVLPLDSLFNVKFRPGDIYTHCFGGSLTAGTPASPGGRESIVDANGKLKPFVAPARKKGVIFDVGFGGSSFLFSEGIPAIKSGWYPNSISTDQHTESMNNAMKDMPNIMSLFMAMGMPFNEVIKASTMNPANEIKRPELGNLSVGSVADIALFNMRTGKFGFYARDGKIAGTRRLECELTIRGGHIVYDLNAIVDPIAIGTDGRPAAKPYVNQIIRP